MLPNEAERQVLVAERRGLFAGDRPHGGAAEQECIIMQTNRDSTGIVGSPVRAQFRAVVTCALALLSAAAACLCLSARGEAQTVRQDFYVANGIVRAAVLSGSTLYIGGEVT